MKKREKKAEAGAPAWMLTYGDMVTLLLTFFVMLLAMSEVKKDDRFIDFMQAIRQAFGYVGGSNHLPLEEVQIPRNVNLTDMLIIPTRPQDFSESPDTGPRGRHHNVTNIRSGEVYVVGGKLHFEELSAELSPGQLEKIAEFAEKLRGYSTQIEIRGHCNQRPVDGTEFKDHFDLAYQRARAVAQTLVECGIEQNRLVLIAAGANEPIAVNAYTEAEREQNDLVELLQVDRLVGEFMP